MRIGKSNILTDMTFGLDFSLSNAGVQDGNPENIFNPDFSYFSTISGINPTINIFNMSESSDYIAIHGIRFNAGPNETAFIRIIEGTNTILETVEIKSGSSVFVTRTPSTLTWRIEAYTSGGFAITVSYSYIAAGIWSEFPRNGTRGGEYIPYLGNNKRVSTTSNQLAQPVTRTIDSVAKQVTLSCPNAPRTWLEDDLQDIFEVFNEFGILSVQMSDDDPKAAFAGFDLVDDVKVHPQSTSLGSFKLTMRATL